ncbi:outer membrane beta-barrel protein [Vibrio fluvialis]|nr:outer membrane beta-barrel protein [Vibrio fluvialis]
MRKSDIVKFAAGTALLLPNIALAYGMAPRGAPMGSPNMMYGRPYVGMSFNFANVDATVENSSGSRLSFNVDNNSLAGVMLGLRVTPNVAFELRGYGNASEGDYQGQRVSVDYYYGAFTKFILPLTPFFETYALMGFGNQKVTVLDYSASSTDMAYGLGASFMLVPQAKIQLEWLKTYNDKFEDSGYKVDVDESNINLNMVFNF